MNAIIVIPTYQEADNITGVLDRVLAAAPLVDVLVVDDGSPDGTARLVTQHREFRRRVRLLQRQRKAGLGSAYRAGFAAALDLGYEAVVQMDADRSHTPEEVPRLIAALERADVVIGSRYVPGGRAEGWALTRRIVSRAGNAYVHLVLGLGVRDATGGFRAFRAAALTSIDVVHTRSDGYAFQIETTWRARCHGLRIVEVPITFRERAAGSSKMDLRIAVEALLNVLDWRFRGLRPPYAQVMGPRVGSARRRDRVA